MSANDNNLTEQAMLEDKIKATDWEATNEAIEEQVKIGWCCSPAAVCIVYVVSGRSRELSPVAAGQRETRQVPQPPRRHRHLRPGLAPPPRLSAPQRRCLSQTRALRSSLPTPRCQRRKPRGLSSRPVSVGARHQLAPGMERNILSSK